MTHVDAGNLGKDWKALGHGIAGFVRKRVRSGA